MIARIWHGAVAEEKADVYRSYIKSTGLTELRATSGNLGAYLFWREEGSLVHFLLISIWENLEAIKAFAGPEIGKARYYPRDADYLIELEPKVIHYKLAFGDGREGLFQPELFMDEFQMDQQLL